MPKMPKGSAGPRESIHSVTKKVQAKDIMDLRIVTIVKQSPASDPYASIIFQYEYVSICGLYRG
jgi:hypothetical protein